MAQGIMPEWVTFDALESWEYPQVRQFTYHYISADCIQRVMDAEELSSFKLEQSWSSLTSNTSTQADNPIHLRIIAKMVHLFEQGNRVEPVTIIAEDDIRTVCGYCVSDGNHRLWALKLLGRTKFLAILRGDSQPLHQLRSLSKMSDPLYSSSLNRKGPSSVF